MGYTDVLYQANLGAWHLAYRLLTSRPWSQFQEEIDTWLNHNEKTGIDDTNVYSSNDIRSFHNLVTHNGVGSKQAPELMMQCHVVVFLVRLLSHVGYLPKSDSLEFNDDQLNAGRILHHFMRAAYYNTHETTHVLAEGENFTKFSAVRIGRLTNPSLALINHSCDPNYRRVSNGTVTYGFACKPIGKGKEICDLYCKPFSTGSLADRQKYLAKYNFTCECSACSQDWPNLQCLPSSVDDLPIKQYNQPQNRINNQIKRYQRAEESYNKISKKKDVTIDEEINALILLLEELHKLVKQPHQMICYWENVLHQAFLSKYASKVSYRGSSNAKILWPKFIE